MVAEAFGSVNRVPRIQPYLPARNEQMGLTTDTLNAYDVGKPLKLSGDTTVLPASGEEIYGFIESLNVGKDGGYHIGGALCDVGHEVLAWDESGTLAVGDLVVAGTAIAFGTQMTNGAYNVIAGAPTTHRWQVMAKYTSGAHTGKVMLRKV